MRLLEYYNKVTGKNIEWYGDAKDFYSTIIKSIGIDKVAQHVPFPMDVLVKAYKQNKYFNTEATPLRMWDTATGMRRESCSSTAPYIISGTGLTYLLRKEKITCYSLSDCVCLLKECARIMVEQELEKDGENVEV